MSLHAKCLVVDQARALVTSANFTERGQTRNIEVGVLISDRGFARRLHAQWWGLVSAGLVRRWTWATKGSVGRRHRDRGARELAARAGHSGFYVL